VRVIGQAVGAREARFELDLGIHLGEDTRRATRVECAVKALARPAMLALAFSPRHRAR
jgi:hypothetical protein